MISTLGSAWSARSRSRSVAASTKYPSEPFRSVIGARVIVSRRRGFFLAGGMVSSLPCSADMCLPPPHVDRAGSPSRERGEGRDAGRALEPGQARQGQVGKKQGDGRDPSGEPAGGGGQQGTQ